MREALFFFSFPVEEKEAQRTVVGSKSFAQGRSRGWNPSSVPQSLL